MWMSKRAFLCRWKCDFQHGWVLKNFKLVNLGESKCKRRPAEIGVPSAERGWTLDFKNRIFCQLKMGCRAMGLSGHGFRVSWVVVNLGLKCSSMAPKWAPLMILRWSLGQKGQAQKIFVGCSCLKLLLYTFVYVHSVLCNYKYINIPQYQSSYQCSCWLSESMFYVCSTNFMPLFFFFRNLVNS